MTYNVLAELFGTNNIMIISSIIPFAVSNMFYERLIQHYNLEKLCKIHEVGLLSSKLIARKRGDVLEAYIAAIEMDISRCGYEYREIREWLLRVMTLRLKSVLSNDSSSASLRKAGGKIWRDVSLHHSLSDVKTGLTNFEISSSSSSSVTTTCFAMKDPLHTFRQVIFERMNCAFGKVFDTYESNPGGFWIEMKYYFDELCSVFRENEKETVLSHYYRA